MAIAPNAFENQSNLNKVELPSTLTVIGERAFYNSPNLTEIEFNQDINLLEIKSYAFYQTALTSFELPQSVRDIGDFVFSGIDSLTSFTLHAQSQLVTIGKQAFSQLEGLDMEMVLPNTVEYIGEKAFYESVLMQIVINEGSAISHIGERAFSFTQQLDIVIPETLSTLNNAFSDITTEEIFIPEWVTQIGDEAFMSADTNSQIDSITIDQNNGLVDIGRRAFYNLTNTVIDLKETPLLKSVGEEAFYGCQGLTSFEASSITHIGQNAFSGCDRLETFSSNGEDILYLFDTMPQNITHLYIASGAIVVKQGAYEDMESLTDVSFSATVKEIEKDAFKNAINLERVSLEMQESLNFVGKDAFAGTKWLNDSASGVVYIGKIAYDYKSDGIENINIISGTTAISEYAFYQSDIVSLSIPSSVIEIGEMAVAQSSNLTQVNISSGSQLKSIRARAFYNNDLLESINLPLSVENIGQEIFAGCNNLVSLDYSGYFLLGEFFGQTEYTGSYSVIQNTTEYYIPSTLTNIRIINNSQKIVDYALQNISTITVVTIPTSVREIGTRAFSGCSSLNNLNILRGSLIETIGEYAFEGCSSLTTIALPLSASDIEEGILSGCNSLSEMTINGNLELFYLFGSIQYDNSYAVTIGDIDYYLPLSLEHITIIEGSLKVAKKAYYQSKITSIVIPSSVTTIEPYAFYRTEELSVITIPQTNNLELIGEYAFYGAKDLTSFTIYENIIFIGDMAFYGCESLADITVLSQFFETGFEVFKNTPYQNNQDEGPIYVGNTLIGFAGDVPTKYSLSIENSTTAIAAYAFENQTGLRHVILPSGIEAIGKGAFKNCTGLMRINIEDLLMLKRIEDEVFYNCQLLQKEKEITIPQSVQYIGKRAFYNCSELNASFETGSQLTDIGAFSFALSGISSIDIPTTVINIDEYAFSASALKQISIAEQNSIEIIGEGAFYELKDAVFNLNPMNNLTHVERFAFYGCEQLTSFIAPNIEFYGEDVFYDCKNLEEMTLTGDKALYHMFGTSSSDDFDIISINEDTYSAPKSLTTVYLSQTADSILDYAFYDCKSVVTIYLNGVNHIGDYAFYGCENLERVIWSNLRYIGDYAFEGCQRMLSSQEEGNSVLLSSSIRTIGDYAFNGCSNIQNMELAEETQLRYIGERAFANLTNTEFDLADINKSLVIGDYAFRNCNLLEEFNAVNIEQAGYGVFNGCQSISNVSLTSENFAGKIFGHTDYDKSYEVSFEDVEYNIPLSLTTVNVSKTMTTIRPFAFAGFETVQTYNLINISVIRQGAFEGNTALTSINLPSSVVRIGDFAFDGCENLEDIQFELEDNLTYIGEEAFHDTKWYENLTQDMQNETLYIGRVAYIHIGEINGTFALEQDTMGISPKAFIDQSSMTSLELPLTIIEIGEKAFYNCFSLESITMGGNYTLGSLFGEEDGNDPNLSYTAVQGDKTYYIPQSLQSVTIRPSATKIVDFAFANMTSLTDINIAPSVYDIGNKILYGSYNIESMTLSGDIILGSLFGKESYTDSSYSAIQNGEEYYIPSALYKLEIIGEKIADYAYSNIESLTTVDISSSITKIGRYAFSGCSQLENITLSKSITSIGNYAFQNCLSFTSIA
ncbi:MAG: leucine-rich repeat domain-containing protein, partial [Bacillota bacterium]